MSNTKAALLAIADFVEKYDAEISYTIADEGIWVSLPGEDAVCIGHIDGASDAVEIRRIANALP